VATSPQPSGGNAAEGWTLKQIANDIPLTPSAREAIELAQRLATTSGAARTEPLHVLAAIVLSPRNPAHKAMVALNVDMDLSPFSAIDPCGYPGLPVTQTRDLGLSDSASAMGEKLAARVIHHLEHA